jgi:hypothetical protein
MSGQGKIDINSDQGYIAISNAAEENKLAGIAASSSLTSSAFWAGGTNPDSTTNPFRVTLGGDLYAINAEIKGVIRATSGGFGTFNPTTSAVSKGWKINADGIQAIGADANIQLGNYFIKSANLSDFQIHDSVSGQMIMATDTVGTVTGDPKRILLGDYSRQVEVVKSAGLWPLGSTATLAAGTTDDKQQYRSGGLRNIYTILEGNLSKNGGGDVLEFPSAIKGDMLVVWDNSGTGGSWRRIVETWIKVDGAPTTTTTGGTTTGSTTGSTTEAPTTYKRCTEFDVANSLCGPSDTNLCDSGGCASGADCTTNFANRCVVTTTSGTTTSGTTTGGTTTGATTTTTEAPTTEKRCTEFDVANEICAPGTTNLCDNGGCGNGSACTGGSNRCA